MTDLIELLKKPKEWVAECQKHLVELGYTEPYNYDRFINEEIGELVSNCIEGKHKDNRALLIDDLCDSIWTVAAKLEDFYRDDVIRYEFQHKWIIHSYTKESICKISAFWVTYQRTLDNYYLAAIIITLSSILEHENADINNALSALIAENYSKLDFSIKRRAEVFRTGKIQKKDADGTLYDWYRPADFSKF